MTNVISREMPGRTLPTGGGVQSLAANTATGIFSGYNAGQRRLILFVSNLDAALVLYVRNDLGKELFLVPPGVYNFPISEDVKIFNPSNTTAVNYIVSEKFEDKTTAKILKDLEDKAEAVSANGGGSRSGGSTSGSGFSSSAGGGSRGGQIR